MKAVNCCRLMEMELTSWKAIIYDIVRRMERLPNSQKEKIRSHIEDFHMLIEDLDARVEDMRESCTPDTPINAIQTEKDEFAHNLHSLRVKAENALEMLGTGHFGG